MRRKIKISAQWGKTALSAGLLFDRAKKYRQFFRVCYLMITFLSAALKGGKTSTWRMVSILSGDTPLFFCNGRFSFCFFAFFQKFCFCKCSKRVRLIFASGLLQSYLIHVSVLWGFFNLHFAIFRKFCFCKCSKRVRLIFASVLLQSFLLHLSPLSAVLPFATK